MVDMIEKINKSNNDELIELMHKLSTKKLHKKHLEKRFELFLDYYFSSSEEGVSQEDWELLGEDLKTLRKLGLSADEIDKEIVLTMKPAMKSALICALKKTFKKREVSVFERGLIGFTKRMDKMSITDDELFPISLKLGMELGMEMAIRDVPESNVIDFMNINNMLLSFFNKLSSDKVINEILFDEMESSLSSEDKEKMMYMLKMLEERAVEHKKGITR